MKPRKRMSNYMINFHLVGKIPRNPKVFCLFIIDGYTFLVKIFYIQIFSSTSNHYNPINFWSYKKIQIVSSHYYNGKPCEVKIEKCKLIAGRAFKSNHFLQFLISDETILKFKGKSAFHKRGYFYANLLKFQ